MGNGLSSMSIRPWEKPCAGPEAPFHPVGGRRPLAGAVVCSPPPSPLQALLLYPSLWSPSKSLQNVLFGTSPEDHPSVEARANCSPRPQPQGECQRAFWSQAHPVVSPRLGSLPGELHASRTRNMVSHARGGTTGAGGAPGGGSCCLTKLSTFLAPTGMFAHPGTLVGSSSCSC